MRTAGRDPPPAASQYAPQSDRSIPQIPRRSPHSDSAPAAASKTTLHPGTSRHPHNPHRRVPSPPSDAPPEIASLRSSQTLSAPSLPPPTSYYQHPSAKSSQAAPVPAFRSNPQSPAPALPAPPTGCPARRPQAQQIPSQSLPAPSLSSTPPRG